MGYNPYRIKSIEINRFKGIMVHEPGAMIPDKFVGNSNNLISVKVGQTQTRQGIIDEDLTGTTGPIKKVEEGPKALIYDIYTDIWINIKTNFSPIPIQSQVASAKFGERTYA